jgi:hypothetical protein
MAPDERALWNDAGHGLGGKCKVRRPKMGMGRARTANRGERMRNREQDWQTAGEHLVWRCF